MIISGDSFSSVLACVAQSTDAGPAALVPTGIARPRDRIGCLASIKLDLVTVAFDRHGVSISFL